jgi:hypothetical protein
MKRFVMFWMASLVLVVMATFAFAQNQFPQNRLPQPQMLSGNDVGFRMDGTDVNGRATGTFMVRYNGEWITVGPSMMARPAK